ncbi:hypothetical protein R1flu_022498 [Riccia fluitans]|uniref:Uncharacterized protein n=1 Tax=Riccia fluitans TaxID=41844 RepID=A0ABD1XPF5_9MARC
MAYIERGPDFKLLSNFLVGAEKFCQNQRLSFVPFIYRHHSDETIKIRMGGEECGIESGVGCCGGAGCMEFDQGQPYQMGQENDTSSSIMASIYTALKRSLMLKC